MADLAKMSANRLAQEIEKLGARDSALLNALIAGGYGNTTGNELDAMVKSGTAPKLVIDARKASHAYLEAVNELDRRKRWHGGEKPIKNSKFIEFIA